jgi:hypothetical protein
MFNKRILISSILLLHFAGCVSVNEFCFYNISSDTDRDKVAILYGDYVYAIDDKTFPTKCKYIVLEPGLYKIQFSVPFMKSQLYLKAEKGHTYMIAREKGFMKSYSERELIDVTNNEKYHVTSISFNSSQKQIYHFDNRNQ